MDERERMEFVSKSYVYLSKLVPRHEYDRFLIARAQGTEPMLAAVLSVLVPVWVEEPVNWRSDRGKSCRDVLTRVEHTYPAEEYGLDAGSDEWPPGRDVLGRLYREASRGI